MREFILILLLFTCAFTQPAPESASGTDFASRLRTELFVRDADGIVATSPAIRIRAGYNITLAAWLDGDCNGESVHVSYVEWCHSTTRNALRRYDRAKPQTTGCSTPRASASKHCVVDTRPNAQKGCIAKSIVESPCRVETTWSHPDNDVVYDTDYVLEYFHTVSYRPPNVAPLGPNSQVTALTAQLPQLDHIHYVVDCNSSIYEYDVIMHECAFAEPTAHYIRELGYLFAWIMVGIIGVAVLMCGVGAIHMYVADDSDIDQIYVSGKPRKSA